MCELPDEDLRDLEAWREEIEAGVAAPMRPAVRYSRLPVIPGPSPALAAVEA